VTVNGRTTEDLDAKTGIITLPGSIGRATITASY